MGKQANIKVLVLGLIILLLLSVTFSMSPLAEDGDGPKLTIVYFYENACRSCDPEGEFTDLFNQLVGEDKQGLNIELLMYNTFHTSSSNLMNEYVKNYEVPKDKRNAPIVFIDNTFLSGQDEIESGLKDQFLKAKEDLVTNTLELSSILYFNVTGCSSCIEVEKFLSTLQNVNIKKLNISELDNVELVKSYFRTYKVPEDEQSVPIIFIGDSYLSGEEDIKQYLIEKIENGEGLNSLLPIQDGKAAIEDELSAYEVLGVLVTGFINGLNPCSISMLLFFLSMLMVKNVSLLKMGLSFIAGKFITYFLLGTLLFNVFAKLEIPWFQTAVKILLLLMVLIIALLNLRDYFATSKEEYNKVLMQLPVFLRKKNHQWIKKLTSISDGRIMIPVSFGLGTLISIGEFLCTGQIYLATIVSVLQRSQTLNMHAVIYFLIYGLAFVLPLILITIIIHKGRGIFDVSEWIREKMPMIKLINAIAFILFGVVIWIWF